MHLYFLTVLTHIELLTNDTSKGIRINKPCFDKVQGCVSGGRNGPKYRNNASHTTFMYVLVLQQLIKIMNRGHVIQHHYSTFLGP